MSTADEIEYLRGRVQDLEGDLSNLRRLVNKIAKEVGIKPPPRLTGNADDYRIQVLGGSNPQRPKKD